MLRLEFLGWYASVFFFSLSELGPVRKEPEERGKINSPHLAGPECLCAIKGGHTCPPLVILSSSTTLLRLPSWGLFWDVKRRQSLMG